MSAQVEQLTPEPFVEFDEANHIYYVDGRRMRFSVTEVLKLAGYYDPRWFTDAQRQRGTDVHHITAVIDRAGKCDLRKVPERYRGYVRASEKWKRDEGIEGFKIIEQIVICPALDYAGRFDRLFPIRGGVIDDELIDVKTNERGSIYDWVRLQLIGYGYAMNARRMRKRRVVCFMPNGEYTQRRYPVREWQADLAEWFQAIEKAKEAQNVNSSGSY